ncbi:MAG: beta-galactosidase [Phycisphaerae bacterium]|nr:beta-galactosidase [Phycisphaerae bacterium]
MPAVTYDGQSFMLDGRRVWIASAGVEYARVARASWADRIQAAKLAGFNTIDTTAVWSRHEPRAGVFDFTGDNDVRHFVKLVGEAGMWLILRVGPFVGAGLDGGGLPAWLTSQPGVALRTKNAPFLEASSRYVTALVDQVKDLQLSSTGRGGPLMLVKSEGNWTCGHDDLAVAYLGELNRYLREAGINIPVINSHNLWQSVESEIDGWSGGDDMLSAMRQLNVVRADQPKFIIDLSCEAGDDHSARDAWGAPFRRGLDGPALTRRIAEVLAGGGHFSLTPFHGGTNFGFAPGRLDAGSQWFGIASADRGAPLDEAGAPGASYHALRRIATFAARFGRVFANLNASYQPVAIDPARGVQGPKGKNAGAPQAVPGVSVIHRTGTHGGFAMVFNDGAMSAKSTSLLLPDGTSLPVDLDGQSVVWCLMDAPIGPRANLDYSNLSAMGVVGRSLVVFGNAGARAVMSVNGSPVEAVVPSGKTPEIIEVEGISIVVLNMELAETTYLTDDAVLVGVAGLTWDHKPIAHASHKHYTRIDSSGQSHPAHDGLKVHTATGHERASLSNWTCAGLAEYVDGSGPRFASIPGPAPLAALGAPTGYGWYRIAFKSSATRRARAYITQGGDRLHVFQDAKELGVIGQGPGATDHADLSLKKGGGTVVVLAENFGEFVGGAHMGGVHSGGKGLSGHLLELSEIKPGKPKVVSSDPVDILAFRAPLWDVREGDTTLSSRLDWSIGKRKSSLVVKFAGENGVALPCRAVLLVNDQPVAYVDRAGPVWATIDGELLSKGASHVQLAIVPEASGHTRTAEELAHDVDRAVTFYEIEENLSAKAEWAFAKWEQPAAGAFHAPKGKAHGPTWWRAILHLSACPSPLFLELDGVTKGQVFVNGRHLGRYFVATSDGEHVGPQTRWYVPASWLKAGAENEVVLFDEHGGNPSKCRAVFDHARVVVNAKPI